MLLLLLLDGRQGLAGLGVAEFEHGGVVHAGNEFLGGQQVAQQISVALFLRPAGGGLQVLGRLAALGGLCLHGGHSARQHLGHGIVMVLLRCLQPLEDLAQGGVAGGLGGLMVFFRAELFVLLQVFEQALLLFGECPS